METATILSREALKNEIMEMAEAVAIDHTMDYCDKDESNTYNSEVEFEMYGKLIVVEFESYVRITRARFTGTYDCPPDDDDIEVEISEMKIDVTNDYEPLENLNAFINQN